MDEDVYGEDGQVSEKDNVYEKFERQVEDIGDGTGEFLWPRHRRSDGKWFGFDREVLARKRAKYLDRTQFRAQYYNDPNDPETMNISYEKFQYYDKKYLSRSGGHWFFKNERLNLSASIDFAFTTKKKSDYTALVVIGIDRNNCIYVLDIDRFKTDRINDYYSSILSMHTKWGFRKLRAEITAAQSVIVKDLKNNYIKPNGIALSIEEFSPTRFQGSKEERIASILQPRYDNMQIWHYQGGSCQLLEEEVIQMHPAHDDIKDAFASAIDAAIPPSGSSQSRQQTNVVSHPKFGGVRF